MKVYELAKELNIKSIDLVDKIRKDWKLPVRSYMEVLTKEQEKQIRSNFKKEQGSKTSPSSSKTVKKTIRKKAPVKKTKTVKKAESSEEVAREPSKKLVKKASQKIIRRKKVEVKPLSIQKSTSVNEVKTSDPEGSSQDLSKEMLQQASSKTKDPEPSLKEKLQQLSSATEEPADLEEEKKKAKKFSEKDVSLKQFRASDFRKREVIFQPKKKKSLTDRRFRKNVITTPKAVKRIIKFYSPLSVGDLSRQMMIKTDKLISKLKAEGLPASVDTKLDLDIVSLIAPEFGFEIKDQQKTLREFAEELRFGDIKAEPCLCPPVVTVMGHVDHGKTTLLDTLRKTRVTEKEAGGITQHIGAYSLEVGSSFITFIDTPGHEAFAEMRARGAGITDIVVIVVAADDGVSSQTLEAIQHAKSAKVPIIVAINKIDKAGADPEKVKQTLSQHELVPEEWGGDTLFSPISALTGQGVKELLDQIQLVAEMQEIKANPKQSAEGVIIESRMDKGRGWVASLIIKNGTLKKSQYIMTESLVGRVRQMTNDRGQSVSSAGPGFPVEVSGFDEAPKVGDLFFAVQKEKPAKDFLMRKQSPKLSSAEAPKSAEELLKLHNSQIKELALVIKADVGGSLEAIKNSLSKINSEEVKINIVYSNLGAVKEGDILLAAASKADVIGFNVRPDSKSEKLAKSYGISIFTYTVIYELIEGVKKRAIGVMDPSIVDESCGKAEVRQIFSISGKNIAGTKVVSGKVGRKHLARLVRDGKIVYEGKIDSLRRFKEDAKEVDENFECGIGLENFNDIKNGDIIETFIKKEVVRTEL